MKRPVWKIIVGVIILIGFIIEAYKHFALGQQPDNYTLLLFIVLIPVLYEGEAR